MKESTLDSLASKLAIFTCVAISFMFGMSVGFDYDASPSKSIFSSLAGASLAAIAACVISHCQLVWLTIEERVAERKHGIEFAEREVGCSIPDFNLPLTREWWEENADDTLATRIPTRHGIGEYEIEPTTKGREGVDLTVWDSDWNKRFATDGSIVDSGWRPFVTVNLPTITTVGQLKLLRRALGCVEVVVE